MSEPLVKIVGECPFCTKGDENKRHVKKILRNSKSEYWCGVGEKCIIVKLYASIDESQGYKDSKSFY